MRGAHGLPVAVHLKRICSQSLLQSTFASSRCSAEVTFVRVLERRNFSSGAPAPWSLSLLRGVPTSTLSSIRQLPEVDSALSGSSLKESIELLKRAADVFEQIAQEGAEHQAVLYLLGERLNDVGSHEKAVEMLQRIINIMGTDVNEKGAGVLLRLAQSKAEWNNGNFARAQMLSEEALDLESHESDDSTAQDIALREGCAMNALGLSRLASLNCVDKNINDNIEQGATAEDVQEADECRVLLGEAAQGLHDGYLRSLSQGEASGFVELGLAGAAAYSNKGVADLICSKLDKQNNEEELSIDMTLQSWNKGLSLLDELAQTPQELQTIPYTAFSDMIQARIHCNIAWATLFTDTHTDKLNAKNLTSASEHSRDALKLYDGLIEAAGDDDAARERIQPSMARALSLVASCYARAGSAVTAEGLFQSATDTLSSTVCNSGPLHAIDRRDALMWYGHLCSNWEKRQRDAERLREEARNIDSTMTEGWQGKWGIYSGLWFFNTSDFK
mmetsp:Transcript_9229/g.13080  ORF Transcript_9229/g.13080 Transcript_9229/m.13080 type:complete len:503 (-) Transcript_9229:338-1846(-)